MQTNLQPQKAVQMFPGDDRKGAEGQEGWITMGRETFLEAMDMFIILIAVIISWVYTCVKTLNCTP